MVDDSAVIRRAISDLLTADPEIEVIGHAANGKLALEQIQNLHPDVITLDVEMPVMDGLETLRNLRQIDNHVPVIMCSTLTERGAIATLDALSLGASCYVTKPHTSGSIEESLDSLRRELLPKVKALGGHRRFLSRPTPVLRPTPEEGKPDSPATQPLTQPTLSPGPLPSSTATAPAPLPVGTPKKTLSSAPLPAEKRPSQSRKVSDKSKSEPARSEAASPPAPRPAPAEPYVVQQRTSPPTRVDLVVIGVSTGGPNALAVLLPALPKNLPVPVLIVQHMPPVFTKLVAERLNQQCALSVHEAAEGDAIAVGSILIAPGDFHMVIERRGDKGTVRLNKQPPENFCRPAADVLFRSAVESYGSGLLAVVLTGMGCDGMIGCETVRKAGGQVIVQDAETSVVWGMPGSVAERGLAEAILPIKEIASEIVRRVSLQRKP